MVETNHLSLEDGEVCQLDKRSGQEGPRRGGLACHGAQEPQLSREGEGIPSQARWKNHLSKESTLGTKAAPSLDPLGVSTFLTHAKNREDKEQSPKEAKALLTKLAQRRDFTKCKLSKEQYV